MSWGIHQCHDHDQDDDLRPAPVLFSDSFDADTSEIDVRFGAGNGIEDYSAQFGYDQRRWHSAAPNATGGSTRGLRVAVNKADATAGGAAG